MRDFEPSMMFHVDRLVRELLRISTANPSQAVDITDRCRYLGLDIVGALGFGTDLRLQIDETNRFMLPGMDQTNLRSNVYVQFPLLKKAGMELFFYPAFLSNQLRYYKKIFALMKERRAIGTHAKLDLFLMVSGIKDPDTGKSMRFRDLWSEAAFFIPAGGDTTATTLTGLFFWLARNSACYNRLAAEIRGAFSSPSDIHNGPTLLSLPYLRACIDETLRITPPIPTFLWRELPKSAPGVNEPLTIDGHVVPLGTRVSVNIYALHHSEQCFPEPWSYKPERWLPDLSNDTEETRRLRKTAQDSFTPFSLGPRGCAGKAMAYLEISLVMAKVFWYLDFEMEEGWKKSRGSEREFKVRDRFGATHKGPLLVFRPRFESWDELMQTEEV